MATLGPPEPEQNYTAEHAAPLSEALHRYWGYESFRPGQENIVRSIAAGRDACVVMPTGGGKSLCYQLPAVLDRRRTVVVVSPLIALMQDQVAQLEQMGIPAAFLNSSLSSDERSLILRRASQGHYRLLYLSPERIAPHGSAACRFPASPSTKPIASPNGATPSAPSTASLAASANFFRTSPSSPSPPARLSASATISSSSSASVIPTNTSPAFAAPICDTSSASVTPERKMNCSSAPSSRSRTEA